MERKDPDNPYDLPRDFYIYVKPYLEDTAKIETQDELIRLWQKALDQALQYPESRELIAEWTMSIGSRSPFIHDNDLFQAIHNGFGSLEVADSYLDSSKKNAEEEWQNQKELFNTLLSENKFKYKK